MIVVRRELVAYDSPLDLRDATLHQLALLPHDLGQPECFVALLAHRLEVLLEDLHAAALNPRERSLDRPFEEHESLRDLSLVVGLLLQKLLDLLLVLKLSKNPSDHAGAAPGKGLEVEWRLLNGDQEIRVDKVRVLRDDLEA